MGYAIVSRHHNNSTSVFVNAAWRLATVADWCAWPKASKRGLPFSNIAF
jgi:hypothetical protein